MDGCSCRADELHLQASYFQPGTGLHVMMSRRGNTLKQQNEGKKVKALMPGADLCWRCSLYIQHGDGGTAQTFTELLSVVANELAAVYENTSVHSRGASGAVM